MDDRESIDTTAAERETAPAASNGRIPINVPEVIVDGTGSFPANEELLQGTGSIPLAASSASSTPDEPSAGSSEAPVRRSSKPRYVRQRTPHRSQGTLDDLAEDNESAPTYTHDSNIAVGGATPLSGMAYRRSRSNMSRVRNGSRYGQYLEIPKGRRSIFASRERARRRRSVLALLAVVTLLVMAAMFIWNLMQQVLG